MIILIGGLGNVGRNLGQYLKETTDQDVFVLGRKPEYLVKQLYPELNYIEQDILDDSNWELEKYITNQNSPNLIINLAFYLGNFANTVVKNNQLIMDNLFNNTKEFDDVVHISTTAVSGYGSQPSNKVVKKYYSRDYKYF